MIKPNLLGHFAFVPSIVKRKNEHFSEMSLKFFVKDLKECKQMAVLKAGSKHLKHYGMLWKQGDMIRREVAISCPDLIMLSLANQS